MNRNSSPDPHLIDLPKEFPVRFFIRVRHDMKGPYIAVPHVHECLEIGYCHEGAGVFVIGKKILPFKAGDVVVIHPAEAHYGQNAEGVRCIWTWMFFDPVRLPGPLGAGKELTDISHFCGPGFNNVLSPAKYPGVDTVMEAIVREEHLRRPHYRDALRGYLTVLLSYFHRVPGGSKPAQNLLLMRDAAHRLAPAVQCIHERYREPLTLKELAGLCFLSTSHFRKSFLQVLGKTPYQFILAYRISMAMIELRTGARTCSAIAMENGFPTLSSFVRKFKSMTGVSPGAWAKRAS